MSSFSFIPEEIVTDILLSLPSKSLIRFRCVCKSWRDLIASSSFARSHLNRNVATRSNRYLYAYHRSTIDEAAEHDQHSLFFRETFETCLILRHPLWTKEKFGIYGSSNGLFCISDQIPNPNSRICIWNPSIHKYRTLPQIETRLFDKRSPTHLSFGFHPELNDYMVVRIVQSNRRRSSDVFEVYNLSTNSWKRIRVTLPWLNSRYTYFDGTFLNGIVYWTIDTRSSVFKIATFDTGSKELKEILVPISKGNLLLPSVKACAESLCFFHLHEPLGRKTTDVWMKKEESWNKVDTTLPGKGELVIALSSSIENELLIGHIYVDERRKACNQMAIYNLESKQFIGTGIRLLVCNGHFVAGDYTESLVLLGD